MSYRDPALQTLVTLFHTFDINLVHIFWASFQNVKECLSGLRRTVVKMTNHICTYHSDISICYSFVAMRTKGHFLYQRFLVLIVLIKNITVITEITMLDKLKQLIRSDFRLKLCLILLMTSIGTCYIKESTNNSWKKSFNICCIIYTLL